MQKRHLKLSDSDYKYLSNLIAKGSLKARLFKRATGLMELHRGKTFTEVAIIVGVVKQTVSMWCQNYHSEGLSFLNDKPRSGRPLEIDALQKAKITALACSDPPDGRKRWTLRLLSDKIIELNYCEHISHNQVGLILKKMNLSLT